MKKKEMQERLEAMVTALPTDEELRILDFDFSDFMTADQILTADERDKLLKSVKSARITKATLRRIFTAATTAIKIAMVLK
jgi:hypothetical protein